MKYFSTFLIIITVLALWGCRQEIDFECAIPQEAEHTQQFNLPYFDSIELVTDAEVTLIQGESSKVKATGDIAILDRLEPEVIDKKLVLAHRGCLGTHEPLKIEVTLSEFLSITV